MLLNNQSHDLPSESQEEKGNDEKSKVTKESKKLREPKVINSRAALLEAAPSVNRDVSIHFNYSDTYSNCPYNT